MPSDPMLWGNVGVLRRRQRSTPVESFDLAEAYDAHGPSLLGYAVNVLGDRVAAEDCVQETFLRAWRARTRFDASRGGTRTWLFAIERNVIVDLRRSMARTPPTTPLLTEDAPTEDDNAATVERLHMIEALALLSREHRDVVVAVHLAGRTYAEVAEETGVAVGTLRSRTYYALRALRAHLDDREDS